jgi:hypothetical protein
MDGPQKALTLRSLVRFALKCLVVIIVAIFIKSLWPAATAPSKDPNARLPPESATERTSRQLKEIEDAVKAIQGPNKANDQN